MLKTAKVVGLNSDTQAALALISCPQAQIELRLFTVVYCDLEDAFSRIRQALFEAESVFYASSQSLSARLSETLEAIRHSLDDAQDAQVILAATEEDESGTALYLLGQGADLEAYLLRGEKRTGLGDMTNEHQLISGILQKGDRVILSTKSLTDFLGDHLQKVVNLPLENLEDEIALYLPQAQICPLAAIFIEEEKPQEEVVEEVLLPQEKAVSSHSFSLPPVLSRQSLISLPGKFIPRSRKTFMVLAIVLFILISGGIIFSIKHQQGVKTQDDFTKYFLAAQDQYQKAQSLKDADTNTSLQSFVQAQDLLARALKINPHDSKALELQKQIDNSSGDILKIYQVKDFPLWLDTDLVKKGFVPQDLSLSHGKLLVLDTNQGTLVNIDLATKSPDILAGQDKLGEAKIASLNGSTAWVFSQDKGLLRIDTTDNTLTTAVKPDSDWGNIVDFASPN
ncbi:MAG: hypothetical protein M1142_03795 [Patescibacteria group bacterium]|nr:hypothetical protein [Patescibacteria group bacterium]